MRDEKCGSARRIEFEMHYAELDQDGRARMYHSGRSQESQAVKNCSSDDDKNDVGAFLYFITFYDVSRSVGTNVHTSGGGASGIG